MKNLLILFFTIFIIPNTIFSQGEYLESGQKGLGLYGGFSTNKDENAFGVGVGYSFNGIVDIGFSYSKSTSDSKPEISVKNISPSISLHLFKQNETLPISLSIGANYVKGFYSFNNSDYSKLEMSSSGFIIGGKIFRKIQVGPNFSIMPSFGFFYYSLTIEFDYQGEDTRDVDGSMKNINLGLPFIFDMNNDKFIISPSVSINDDYNAFVIDVSFIFPN